MTRKRLSPAERRDDILAAARSHFTASTYPNASVPQVAADAGTSAALIFHYFGTKAGLYTALLDDRIAHQRHSRDTTLDALDDGQPLHYRVETFLLTHLDAIAVDPLLLPGPGEPDAAQETRRAADAAVVDKLAELIGINDFARHRWAVTGIVGFLHRCAADWAQQDFPADERRPIVEATLGALEGALGDWAV